MLSDFFLKAMLQEKQKEIIDLLAGAAYLHPLPCMRPGTPHL
jgi:hypothetical protein